MQGLRPCLLVLLLYHLWLPSASSTARLSLSDCTIVANRSTLRRPEGIAVDASDNIFVVDTDNGLVMKYADDGSLLGTQVAGPTSSFPRRHGGGIVLTSGGNLLVAEDNGVFEWVPGSSSGQLRANVIEPQGIALTSSGDLFAVDSDDGVAYKFPLGSTTGEAWSSNDLFYPTDVAVDSAGQVYLLSPDEGVWRLPATKLIDGGDLIALGGGRGSALNQSDVARELELDGLGYMWVADNDRVLRCFELSPECELILDGLSLPTIGLNAAGTHFWVTSLGPQGSNVRKCPVPVLMPGATTTTTSTTATATSTAPSEAPPAAATAQPPSGSEAAAELLGEVAAASRGLLDQLQATGAQTQITVSIPGGTVTALRLGAQDSLANITGDAVPVSIATAEGVVELTLPSSLFQGLPASSVPGDSVVLLVSSFSPERAASTGGQQEARGANRVELQVLSGITIDLSYLLSRESPPAQDLQDPVVFQMPGANYRERVRCGFLNETQERWSFRGVETPESNEVGQPLVCNTRHLSFFAAILEAFVSTLLCAQFGLLSAEAIKNLFQDSAWMRTASAWICWGIFAGFGLAVVLAAVLDARRERSQCWKDEFFLIARGKQREAADAQVDEQPAPETGDEPQEASGGERPSFVKRTLVGGLVLGCACLRCLYESSALMEAVDEIVSSWFEYWAELRGACDAFCEVLAEGSGATAGALVQRAAATFLMASSRRMVACSLRVSNDAVAFVLEDEDLQEFLVEGRGSDAVGTRKDDWRTSEDQRVAWTSLHDAVVHHVLEHTQRHTICGLPSIVLSFFLYHNPVGALFVQDIFHSCKKRVLLLAVDFMGALALSCAFFDAAGLVRGKPIGNGQDCGGHGIAWRIGRFLAIATGSLVLAALPAALIESLQTKGFRKVDYPGSEAWVKQLRIWATQDLIVWVLSLLYIAFCSFFVLVFLASIGPEDHEDWSSCGFIALSQEFLLMPAFLALTVPAMTIAFLHLHVRVHGEDHAAVLRRSHETFFKETNMMLPVMQI